MLCTVFPPKKKLIEKASLDEWRECCTKKNNIIYKYEYNTFCVLFALAEFSLDDDPDLMATGLLLIGFCGIANITLFAL